MATAVIAYRPDKDYRLAAPIEPRNTLATTNNTIFALPDANQARAAVQDLTDDAVRDLSPEEALSVEIERLCSATLAIDNAFCDIGKQLSDALVVQCKRADVYNVCFALEAQWNEHHLTYQALLWRSREFAGEAQGIVDDFRELVLTSLRDPDITQAEKQEIIREQIQVLQNTSQPSQNLCQEFLDFGRSLDGYVTYFSEVVEGFGIGEQSKKVAGLKDRLTDAKVAMQALSEELKSLGWKFAADVAVTGISLLLAFVVPRLWAKLADVTAFGIDFMKVRHSGLQLLELRKQSDEATKIYETIKAECDLEDAGLGQMVKLEDILNAARPQVQEVTVKLGIFASVWAAITADIRKLKNSLHRAEDPTSMLFVQRVRRLERMYGYLSQALRHYQVTVQLA